MCPITTCLHVGFKSDRGLRKHINTGHPWYYYFDEQPVINRDKVAKKDEERRKSSTHNMPAFSLTDGLGEEFLSWLSTPCGGGKSHKQGIQIGRRAMKFLMASMGATEVEKHVDEEYVDCCLGSPCIIMNFLKVITEQWKISSSAALNYMKSINDLLDFRKANGVSDDVLRSYTVTEVYIRRGKENLAKQKKLEYSRNLDLERLIARESWATIEEMEQVIPYHSPKYKHILKQCNADDAQPSISHLAFATRFIATFLFLRVKCTRPMTYQFITIPMLKTATTNGGFIDQTTFKTEEMYAFDTLILSPDVLRILDSYVNTVRPLLHPSCDYLVLTTNGKQYTAFGSAMSLLVHQAIGKYVNPTRYRQIIESESAERLTPTEMDAISKDQKHSSYVAKRIYQKRLSRDVAAKGKSCMQKIVGEERDLHTNQLASTLGEVSTADDNELHWPPCNEDGIDNEETIFRSNSLVVGDDEEEASLVVGDDKEDVSVIVSNKNEVANCTLHGKTDVNISMCSVKPPHSAGKELGKINNDDERSCDKSRPKVSVVVVDDGEMDNSTTHDKRHITVSTSSSNLLPLENKGLNTTPVPTRLETQVETITPITSMTSSIVEICQNYEISHVDGSSKNPSNMTDNDVHPTKPITDVEVKREEVENQVARGTRLKRFSLEEDSFLKEGVRKYGVGRWSHILRDNELTFHQTRTRDSLRMRADTIGLTNKKKRTRKQSAIR